MCADIAGRLLQPTVIAGLALRNRIAMAPMSRYFCPDSAPGDDVSRYYARRAASGVGLIISEGTYVPHPSAASYANVPVFYGSALPGWKRVADAVHAAGGAMFPQLWHTGSFRNSSMGPQPGTPGFGPSENRNAFTQHAEPTHAMTERDIEEVIAAYARAAGSAQALGFDGIEIHGAHGYLIDEFLWAQTNRRSDRYGGDRRSRTRFAVEIVRAIRRSVGADFPVSFRFSQWKQQDYKARLAESPAELADVLEPLAEAGVSILHCSTRRLGDAGFPGQGEMTLAGWTRKISGLPVIAVGGAGLDRPGLVNAAAAPLDPIVGPLDRGEFDVLAVGRALLADPDWVTKLREGRLDHAASYDKAQLETLV